MTVHPIWLTHSSRSWQRIPRLLRHCAVRISVEDQLAAVADDYARSLGTFWDILNIGDEFNGRTCGDGDLADGAIGKYSEILIRFAKIEDQAFGGCDVFGIKNGNEGMGSSGREVNSLESESSQAAADIFANHICSDISFSYLHERLKRVMRRHTVHRLTLSLADALILADEEVEVLVRAGF